jgi:hypothetical protein
MRGLTAPEDFPSVVPLITIPYGNQYNLQGDLIYVQSRKTER